MRKFEHDFSDIEKHYPTYHGGQTIYLSYKGAPAISVTRGHFCAYVISWESHPRSGDIPERETDGRYRLLVGYEVLDEKAARASNPPLFGAPDKQVLEQMTRDDKRRWIEDQTTKKDLEAEFDRQLKEVGHL